MNERQNIDNSGWYQPNIQKPMPNPPEQKPKHRKTALLVVLCIALLVGAIALTAVLFGEDDHGGSSSENFFDDYADYFQQMQEDDITGENEIQRVEPDPAVKLTLYDNEGLTALTYQALYTKCIPSIVGIRTETNGNPRGWGTGVIMTEDGYIITNTHVLEGADAVEVVLYDGSVYDALLVGADVISDIGVLKIQATGLTPAEFADSALVQVGDEAIAIGNPLGEEFSGTMTTGIISGVSRDMNYKNRTMTLLQTNAALNSGNSGGALFNIYGQVVGITNMKMMGSFVSSVEGVGFAIPTATVKQMVDAILRDGAVVGRPGLGIVVYDINGISDEYPDGMMVNSVSEGSDAQKQGLAPGDVITEIDGKPAQGIEVVRGVIESKNVGDTVRLKVWREGEVLDMEIALIDQNDF